MLQRILVVVLVLGLPLLGSQGSGSAETFDGSIILTQLPLSTGEKPPTPFSETERVQLGEGARVVLISPAGSLRVLSEGFASAADPNVSFDGERLLFAGKRRAKDDWNIFEMSIDGSNLRQITRDIGNCRSPVYQSTFYTIVSAEPWYQITFVSDAAGELNEEGGRPSTSLYSCRLDGSEVRRLTFNPSSDFDPYVMSDGRILFSSWQRSLIRHGPHGRVGLFSVNSDGTDVAVFSSEEGRRLKQMPCVTRRGLCVFVESDVTTWDGSGQLAAVKMRRNLHSHQQIAASSELIYHSPSPLPGGDLLVSARPADGTGSHAVYQMEPESGRASMIFDSPQHHDIQPQPVAARPIPDGRSSVVTEEDPNGQLYVLNYSISDIPELTLDKAERLRVLEGLPERYSGGESGENALQDRLSSLESPFLAKRLLGEVPVEKDGSVFVQVPANIPIQLQLVDSDGLALRTCSWIWVKNREPRGCIGCHEDGELTPPNRLVEAVKKAPYNLTLPPGRRRTVDFRRDVVPVVVTRCSMASCHGQGASGQVLTSSAEPDEAAIARLYKLLMTRDEVEGKSSVTGKFVHPGRARTSPLVWHILGRNTSRPWDEPMDDLDSPLPLTSSENLSPLEKRVIIEWIDLGARWRSGPTEDPVAGQSGVFDSEGAGGE